MDKSIGEFDVAMNLYTSKEYTSQIEGLLTLNIPEDMNVGLELIAAGPSNKLVLKRCWATPR